jgi:hypothetical protein
VAKTLEPAGSYIWNDKSNRWTRSDGAGARPASYSLDPAALSDPKPVDQRPPVDGARRERLLEKAIQEELLDGASLLRGERFSAILTRRKPVRHGLHAVASLLTLGLWTTVWIIMAIARKDQRYRLEVDEWGNVWPVMGQTG